MNESRSPHDAVILAVRIRAELADIAQVVERSHYLLNKAIQQHIYTFNLDPLRLRMLVMNLSDCYGALVQDLTQFCEFLEKLDASL